MTVTGTRISFDEAVTEALRLEMHRDPALVIFSGSSEGVAGQLAGSFGPERVVESRAVGAPLVLAACGAAEGGLRAICELGPAECGPGALDQVAEVAALHASNPDTAAPLMVRLAWGDPLSGGGAAASPLGWLLGAEGIKVVAPATAADAKGLIVAAIRDEDPVCVLEHAALRQAVDPVPEGAHTVEIGRARLACEGEGLTLVASGAGVPRAEAAVRELGLDADLLDLRTLQPLDADAVLTSVRKTGRILFVESGAGEERVTAALVSQIWERAFESLDAPPRRIRLQTPTALDARRNGSSGSDPAVETIAEVSGELLEY